jgi:outer membrane protein assembly factor BamD
MSSSSQIARILFAVALASVVSACSSTPKPQQAAGKTLSGTDEQIFLGDTIEKNYDPNVIMKRAEAFFEKEDYPEAVIEYQHFMDLHRVHVLAPYAQFKLAESHFRMVKTIDRDPEPVNKSLQAYEKLLKDYPGSKWESQALDRIRNANEFLAQRHMFVGKFYYRREAYLAAAHRFETVASKYPDLGIAGDALYYLALTYNDLGAKDWAQEKLALLAQRYPGNENVGAGRALLARLNGGRSVAEFDSGALALRDGAAAAPGVNGSGQPPAGAATLTNAQPPSSSFLCRLGLWCRQ